MSVRNDDRVSSAKLKETLDKLWEDRYLGKEPTSHTVEVEHGEVTTNAQNFFNNFDAEIVANFWNNFRDLSNGTMIRLNKSSENTFEQSLLKLRITNDDETYYFKDVLLFRYDGDDAYSVLPTGKRHAALKFPDYGGTNSSVEIIIYPAYPESEYPCDVLRFGRETDEETEVISFTYSVERAVSEDENGAIHTVIVESEAYTETVTVKDKHTIKQDFLPNADWNVNDPEADGYVEGRTHWVEKGTPKQFPEPGEYVFKNSAESLAPFMVSVADLPDTIVLLDIQSCEEDEFTIGEYTVPLAELSKFEYEGFYFYTDPEWDGVGRVNNYQYYIQCAPITSDSVLMFGADFNSKLDGLAVVNMAKSVVHKLDKKYYDSVDKSWIESQFDDTKQSIDDTKQSIDDTKQSIDDTNGNLTALTNEVRAISSITYYTKLELSSGTSKYKPILYSPIFKEGKLFSFELLINVMPSSYYIRANDIYLKDYDPSCIPDNQAKFFVPIGITGSVWSVPRESGIVFGQNADYTRVFSSNLTPYLYADETGKYVLIKFFGYKASFKHTSKGTNVSFTCHESDFWIDKPVYDGESKTITMYPVAVLWGSNATNLEQLNKSLHTSDELEHYANFKLIAPLDQSNDF